jgi:hypothetical protein
MTTCLRIARFLASAPGERFGAGHRQLSFYSPRLQGGLWRLRPALVQLLPCLLGYACQAAELAVVGVTTTGR